jgi:hypothetical protein
MFAKISTLSNKTKIRKYKDMPNQEEDRAVIDQLSREAHTLEDWDAIDEMRGTLERQHGEAVKSLGQDAVELVAGPSGAIVRKEEAVRAQENGQGILPNSDHNRS